MALSSIALIAMIVFIIQARKKRFGAAKKAWISGIAWLVLASLATSTMSPAEKAKMEADRVAEEMATAQAAETAQKERVVAETKRKAARAEAARIEAAKPKPAIGEAEFLVTCESQIRKSLKLPDTTRFAGFLEQAENRPTITETEAYYRSWVEGENSFGGKVRNQFICTYKKSDNVIRTSFIK